MPRTSGPEPEDRLLERIPEPELMDEPEQARAYAEADFVEVNQGFVDRFRREFPDVTEGRVVDLGSGPGDIPIRLARSLPRLEITAVDGARAMLMLARGGLSKHGFAPRIHLVLARVPALPLRTGGFDACVSNSLLHHLTEPEGGWREMRRLCRPGAAILVMDLFRPLTSRAAREIVETAAGGEDPILQRDFYNSLRAAFTVDEVRGQLDRTGLAYLSCEVVSERHWLVRGRLP